jgi:hypothetical protein
LVRRGGENMAGKKKHSYDDFLIKESEAVRFFNEATGASCKTVEETVQYLGEHPEAREALEEYEGGLRGTWKQ